MTGRPINSSTPPDMYGQPQVYFRPKDFDAVIWSHGYDITCEQAVRCPCQGASGAPMPDCQNCHGSGFFYVNPLRTKALITGLNRNTQYVQWAPELMGTAAITVRDTDKAGISYLNRITVDDEYAWFTEMVVAHTMVDDIMAVFLSYAPIEIQAVFIYVAPDVPLVKLDPSVYEISPNNKYCVQFVAGNVPDGAGVSFLYKHRVEYHIIDAPHEIRASLQANKQSGALEVIKMPLQAVGRRSHLVDMQRPNFDGSGLIHNDYDTNTP